MKKSKSSLSMKIGTYGLPALAVGLFALFSFLLPDTYPTSSNLRAILSNQSIPALLALGAMIPIVTAKFDLSMGYTLGLSHIVVMYLLVNSTLPWILICLIAIIGAAVVGLINGLLVEFAQIDSFIATLGTGSVLYAFSGWITHGGRIVPPLKGLPHGFTNLMNAKFLGLPIGAFYILALVFILVIVLEYLPAGRGLYVIGSNPRAAELIGIPKRRYVVLAFVSASSITGFAGCLLAAQQQIGNPSIGAEYLLPAFVGALLGSTTIKLGRANALGTLVAVAILAIGVSGIQQLGAEFWATPLFNGLTLLAAVGLAGYSARRRLKTGAEASRKSMQASTPENQ
ncbi:AraH Ribose/xylose/arabinose/galactoside ABC-type transport systems, permease components [Candidatus Nanopelagicaceae bacterium]|jgi:ribose transport system permease protein